MRKAQPARARLAAVVPSGSSSSHEVSRRGARARGLAGALAATALLVAASQSGAVEVGQSVPAFTAPSLDGGKQMLSPAAYKGKVIYIDFWASWCTPCA